MIDVLQVLLAVLWLLFALFGAGILIRNQFVYQFRKNLSARVHDQNMAELLEEANSGLQAHLEKGEPADSYQFRDYKWRYAELEAVPYEKMVLQFWRPLRSFYRRDPARPYTQRYEMSDLTE